MTKKFKLSCCPLCGDKLTLDIPDTVSYIPYDCFQTCRKHGEVSRFFWYPYAWVDKGYRVRPPFPDTTVWYDLGWHARTTGKTIEDLPGYIPADGWVLEWRKGWQEAELKIRRDNYPPRVLFRKVAGVIRKLIS